MGTGHGAATESAASEMLSTFHLAKYRFTLSVTSKIELPLYKGSATHGGFGHALQHISPSFYKTLFQPSSSGALPKPFVLTPPLDTKTVYQAGEKFHFELTLIGNATQHLPICFAALDALGQQLGFGNNKGRYQIEQVDYTDALGHYQPLYQSEQWAFASNIINGQQIAEQSTYPTQRITLALQTRLRLKHNDKILKQAPSFDLFLNRLLGRLSTLAKFYQQQPLLNRDERNELLSAAAEIRTIEENIQWDDWHRFSGRQKEWMKFGGLLGALTYEGDLTPFMPYLKLGEWLNVGGKTSFGLGKYSIATQ